MNTADYTADELAEGLRLLRLCLHGVGDPTRERFFRMNMTLCLHRAATQAEWDTFPPDWQQGRWGMAGGPVEILWQTVPTTPSCLPCECPEHVPINPKRLDLWVPGDCGACDPCMARAELRRNT